MSIDFERPLFALAALLLIPLIIGIARLLKPLFSLDIPLGPSGGAAFQSPVKLTFVLRFFSVMEAAAFVLLFIAASGPRFIRTETIWLTRGADILFVLDSSPSMSGLDMNGESRFDTALALLRQFSDKRANDAVGLIAVGEDSALIMPLSTDRRSLYSRLDSLAIGELGDGTALGEGLALAAFHIAKSQAPRKAVVLITDGENNAGSIHPETAARALGELGVSLWVIGVGSSGIIPFSYRDPLSQMRVSGTFESFYDPETLKAIAERAGGFWTSAPTAEAFAEAFARLDRGELVISRSASVRKEEPFHGVFIAAALCIFLGIFAVRRCILRGIV